MEDTKILDHVIPGEVTQTSPTDRAYWFVLCPCGEAHSRTVTQYWEDGEPPYDEPKVVTHHCFVCMEQGIHYRISPSPPYGVIRQIVFRKPSPNTPQDVESAEDYVPPF